MYDVMKDVTFFWTSVTDSLLKDIFKKKSTHQNNDRDAIMHASISVWLCCVYVLFVVNIVLSEPPDL